jgi:nucleotide-binding universal stress UspA family protein
MANPGFLKKVLWPVDAFQRPSDLWTRTLRSIEALVERNPSLVVQPVYALSPAMLNLSSEFSAPLLMQYRPAAEKALDRLFEDVAIPRTAKPELLVMSGASTSQVVRAISDHAVVTGADLIVLGSHGRSGFKRLLLGSFAETLLHQSKVPVWVVGEKMKRKPDFAHILFPTDFGPTSRTVFRYAVALAGSLGARLTLFHGIPHPIEPVLQSGVYLLGGGWIPIQAYFSREVDQRTRHAEKWAAWAKQQGVDTEVVVDPEGMGLHERITALAKKRRSSLIVMEAESGPVTAALVGSITRLVLRQSDCPVLVLKSQAIKRAPLSRLPPKAA